MTRFRKPIYSNKTGACRRIAQHIHDAAKAMGLSAEIEKSRLSASHYVYVRESDDADLYFKIRVSDHDDTYGGSNWHVWDDQCPSAPIARLAEEYDRAIPVGYRPEDYAARSAAATAAAAKRDQTRRDAETKMLAAVIAEMRANGDWSAIAAGKVIDALYPTIGRARRQRIAKTASRTIGLERDLALAAERGDEAQLAILATRSPDAKTMLINLVGPDRFVALRPAGYPRSLWTS